jgi:hypothetical protein
MASHKENRLLSAAGVLEAHSGEHVVKQFAFIFARGRCTLVADNLRISCPPLSEI